MAKRRKTIPKEKARTTKRGNAAKRKPSNKTKKVNIAKLAAPLAIEVLHTAADDNLGGAANDPGELRIGLVARSFDLRLMIPASPNSGSIYTLDVVDTKGDRYNHPVVSIPLNAPLIASILNRIAAAGVAAGWTFNARFFTSANSGIIVT